MSKKENNSVKKKNSHKKLKATFGALITLVSAIYKLVTGFFVGLIFMASGVYTFAIFLCKMLYAKNLDADMETQYKTYRNMGFLLVIVSIFFLIANIITLNDEPKDYGLIFDIIISAFLIILFILSLKGYFKKRSNINILNRAIKILSLSTALITLSASSYKLFNSSLSITVSREAIISLNCLPLAVKSSRVIF